MKHTCPECGKEFEAKKIAKFCSHYCRNKSWTEDNREVISKRSSEYYNEHKDSKKLYDKTYREEKRLSLRQEAFSHYGTSCVCCGESEDVFLCIDHINGGGNAHRKEIGRGKMYEWLKKNNYPPGFRTLCHNCNMAMSINGNCPHGGIDEKDSTSS